MMPYSKQTMFDQGKQKFIINNISNYNNKVMIEIQKDKVKLGDRYQYFLADNIGE